MSYQEGRPFSKEQLSRPRALIIDNNHAGPPRHRDIYRSSTIQFSQRLADQFGIPVTHVATDSKNHAEDEVKAAMEKGETGLVAVRGGDTTNSLVASWLLEYPDPPGLAALSGGRENVLVQTMTRAKLPDAVGFASVVHGHPTPVDLGVIKADGAEYPFYVSVGIGFDAYAMNKWHEAGKRSRRQLPGIYHRERKGFKPFSVFVTDPLFPDNLEELKEGKALVPKDIVAFPVINIGKYAGRFPLTDSNARDGIMEGVIIGEAAKKWRHLGGIVLDAFFENDNPHVDKLEVANPKILVHDADPNTLWIHHDGEPVQLFSQEVEVYSRTGPSLWVPNHPRTDAFEQRAA